MQEVVRHLRKHFDPLAGRMETFCRQGCQVEGWFKGELLHSLEQLGREGLVTRLNREVPVLGKKIDLLVERGADRHWVELKQWLVGTQKGTRYNAYWYFRDGTLGVKADAAKLLTIEGEVNRWLLILLAANPGGEDWEKGIEAFNAKFSPLRLVSASQPEDFPAAYFLGLLRVDKT